MTGRFTSPTSATGTGDSEFTFAAPDGKHYDCSTGTVKWQARDDAHTASGGKASLRPGSVYYGNVHGATGRLPFVLRVSSTGKSVEEAAALVDAPCTKDSKFVLHVDPIFAHVKIAANGTFTSHPSYTDSLLREKPGQEGRVTMTVKGTFGPDDGQRDLAGQRAARAQLERDAGRHLLEPADDVQGRSLASRAPSARGPFAYSSESKSSASELMQ